MPVLSLACHLPHNAPHIAWRYNYEQTTKQTKAINNSYIYINISCKCDTNRAGHLTLDAYASRPVACTSTWSLLVVTFIVWASTPPGHASGVPSRFIYYKHTQAGTIVAPTPVGCTSKFVNLNVWLGDMLTWPNMTNLIWFFPYMLI